MNAIPGKSEDMETQNYYVSYIPATTVAAVQGYKY